MNDMKGRVDTLPGLARMVIGVAASIGRKAVLNPDLQAPEAEDIIKTLDVAFTAYTSLKGIGDPEEKTDAEAAHVRMVLHQVRLLSSTYGIQVTP